MAPNDHTAETASDQVFLGADDGNRTRVFSLGSATPGLQTADDGSITIYFQTDSPGKDKESNWLPTPSGPFWPVFRTYGPGKAILDHSWKLPTIKRVA